MVLLGEEHQQKQHKEGNRKMKNPLTALASALVSRAALAEKLGQSFGGNRQLYQALGYPLSITADEYEGKYARNDISKSIIRAYPNTCWSMPPSVFEDTDPKETPFEKEYNSLVKKLRLYHYLKRADRLSGIGQYGILFLGFNDGRPLEDPVESATELLYLKPIRQVHAAIHTWEEDTRNERYGKPSSYKISFVRKDNAGLIQGSKGSTTTTDVVVHWTRCIHIAEDCEEDDVFGTPRLEAVYNRILDLEKLCGGSAEMFWKGAFQGIGFTLDEDAELTPQDEDDLEDEMQKYFHGLQRYIRMKNMTAKAFPAEVADPKNHVDVQVSMCSALTGIPKRVLMGTEEAQLAGEQDNNIWLVRNASRQLDFCEPIILRAVIERLIRVGVLPEPKEIIIQWPPLLRQGAKDQADISKTTAEALKLYVESGSDSLMTPYYFFTEVMKYEDDLATSMIEAMQEMDDGEGDDELIDTPDEEDDDSIADQE